MGLTMSLLTHFKDNSGAEIGYIDNRRVEKLCGMMFIRNHDFHDMLNHDFFLSSYVAPLPCSMWDFCQYTSFTYI